MLPWNLRQLISYFFAFIIYSINLLKTDRKTFATGNAMSNSTVIFLTDVSDVWRRPNPVKTVNVHFLLQNPQWNQRMNSHQPCI
jgi:hypothetical protein